MNAQDALKLARRFIELPLEKRRLFLAGLQQEGVDFSVFPIPADVASDARDGLSYAQQRMWFLWQLDPQGAAYNLPMAVRLNGELDQAALHSAFDGLVARHETLRCVFSEQDGQVSQRIVEPFPVAIVSHDLSGLQADQREAQVRTLADAEAVAPFDLARGPLLRVQLLKLTDQAHVLLLTLHHIVADGWSYNVLIDEFIRLYDAASSGTEAALQPLPIQYRDYALWQRSWLEAGEQDRQLDYWRSKLGDEHAPLELPLDHARPSMPSYRGARHAFQVEPALAERLRRLAREQGVTLFMVLLAAFKVLLHRYSGQQAIRVGVPVANRNRAEVEGLIGCFINTQVLHTEIDPLIDRHQLLQRIKETALGAQGHQELPFERLVEVFEPQRSLGRNPLFQVLFNHQSTVVDAGQITTRSGLTLEKVALDRHSARFDLSLDTYESAGRLQAAFTYALDVFDGATVAAMQQDWLQVLEGLAGQSRCPVGEWPLSPAEAVVVESAVTERAGLCIHQLIEQAAKADPHRLAAVSGEHQIDYQALDERANALAHLLLESGVQPDQRVGVIADRSTGMLVGILAVLKAGAAYLPLEPGQPRERQDFMLADSGVQVVVAQAAWDGALPQDVCRIHLDETLRRRDAPAVAVSPDNLAYVIYTSGTTGVPKGVGISHAALVNYVQGVLRRLPMDDIQRLAMVTTPAADLGHTVFYGALCAGKTLHMLDKDTVLDAEAFAAYMSRHAIDAVKIVPSHLQAMLAAGAAALPRRCLIVGGESCPAGLLARIAQWAPGLPVINHYGPTETTVGVLTHVMAGQPVLGRPLDNSRAQVLSDCLQAVPGAARGELYIGGAGLARGYLGQPALTAERFVPDPAAADGARLYRTGDWVRRNAQGELLFAGRRDGQVKIRGYRVELAEIENHLRRMPAIGNAVVRVIDAHASAQLAAWLVPAVPVVDEAARQAFLETLRGELQHSLPEHLQPSHLQVLAQLPVTANGKVDIKALPEPVTTAAGYTAPVTPLQIQLAEIWAQVLQVERVGLTDNFFALGGDSIISIQVVSRARRAGIEFTARALFQHQTILALSGVARRAEVLSFNQQEAEGAVLLAPIQQRFFVTDIAQRHHWNQSVMLKPGQPLDTGVLDQALRALIIHHDALRLRFTSSSTGWSACYGSVAEQRERWEKDSPLWCEQLDSVQALQALSDQAQRSLNLQQACLLRAVYVSLPDGEQRLLLVIHHLAVDGVSWRVLLEDLQQAYQALLAGNDLKLSDKTSSFKVWTQHLHDRARDSAFQQELAYWQGQLQDVSDQLPCDHEGGGRQQKHSAVATTYLDSEWTRRLLQDTGRAYRTQINDLLLTALAGVICRWTCQPSALIRLEGHGREELFERVDVTRTVGWFTTLFPVKLSPQAEISASIMRIKEQLRAVPDKGLGYGVLRYLGPEHAQSVLNALPEGQIVFNYLGQFDQSFDGQQGIFAPAPEGSGQGQSEEAPLGSLLSINGQVYGGALELTWTYSREVFEHATVQRLADEYAQALKDLIEHCGNQDSLGVTPSDFPLATLTQASLDALPVATAQIEDIYGLSPMQHGMLFHSLYQHEAGDYVNQMRVDVTGLDVERFRHAWQRVLEEHEVLRTGFVWQGDLEAPVQVVHRSVSLPVRLYDCSDHPSLDEELQQLAMDERRQGFDLVAAPLLRLILVRKTVDCHHLIYTHHHLLMDGWSGARVLGEVLQRYAGHAPAGKSGHYRDYIAWLQRQDSSTREVFWKKQLARLEGATRLASATGLARSGMSGQAEHSRRLEPLQTERLKRFAQSINVTVNTLVQGAWALLLQRYTGQQTVVFGATVSGRPAQLPGIEEQVGLFINTLPVIAMPSPELRADQWLQALQAHNLELREHEHTPLSEIQRWAGLGGEGLFDSLIVFENYPVSEALQKGAPPGLVFGQVYNHEQTNYALTIAVTLDEALSFAFSYAQDVFDKATVLQVSEHVLTVLMQLCEAPQRALGNLGVLDAAPLQPRLPQPMAPDAPGLEPLNLVQLFELQAARQPEAIALVQGDERLSYAALNRRANALAHRLIEQGVRPEARVGIVARRGLDMVVGLLAILKAGAGYVPLDPEYPAQRLHYMIQDSQLGLILVEPALQARLPDLPGTTIMRLDPAALAEDWRGNPCLALAPASLAYVIYTSGSTGRPKGVEVAHEAIAMHCLAAADIYRVEARDCYLNCASISFDAAVEQLFVPLVRGARVLLADIAEWDWPRFRSEIERHAVSVIDIPPAYLAHINVAAQPHEAMAVRVAILGGEAWRLDLLDARCAIQARQWFNAYGPTEGVVSPLIGCVERPLEPSASQAPLGQPVGRRQVYALDCQAGLAVAHACAEIVLAGAGLARGYLGQPALTAQRFVPDPFGGAGERVYRTGDAARVLPDGRLDFIGRIDQQVSIRGRRIEPGEIERRLLEDPSVREAAVLVVGEAGEAKLVAYLVPDQTGQGNDQEQAWIESHASRLQACLPAYMRPARYVVLERLATLPSGKLDLSALRGLQGATAAKGCQVPVQEADRRMAALWAEVLDVAHVGLDDNFFELGGHSLSAMTLLARVRQALGVEVPLRTLFERPVLADFVKALDRMDSPAGPAIQPVERHTSLAVSYAQQRQWFLWELAPDSCAYNVSSVMRLSGALDVLALQRSFADLVMRHETLRTVFERENGQVVQKILSSPTFTMSRQDRLGVFDEAVQALIDSELSQGFDLRSGPLLRVMLVRLSAQEHVLVIVQHHITCDGVSMQIMIDDLVQLYAGHCQGLPVSLAPLPIQYADYAAWQRNRMDAGERQRQLDYWLARLGGEQPMLLLPWDKPRGLVFSHRGARLGLDVSTELSLQLMQLARRQGVTVFMLLLASFQVLLHRYSGQSDIRVGVPVTHRNRAETERLIGFFVNTQVLRSEVDSLAPFNAFLQHVRHDALQAQAFQDLPFEQLVEALQPERSLGHNPLFQVMFNHQVAAGKGIAQGAMPGVTIEPLAITSTTTQFDLTLDVFEASTGLSASLIYAQDLFEPATVARMGEHWVNLLQAIVADPAQRIADLPLLSRQERERTLQAWNATAVDYPRTVCLHQLIEAQVRRAPQAVALTFEDRHLSYGELNVRANRLAHRLIEAGVGPEVPVGIAMPRSLDMVVGLLAILKAGGAYVPLDPEYPPERLDYMIRDSGMQLLLGTRAVLEHLPSLAGVEVLALDAEAGWLAGYSEADPEVDMSASSLAYVIYTSGSTGRPKGALLTHHNVVRLFESTQGWYQFGADDTWTLFHSYAFDFSVWEMFGALIHGGRLLIVPYDTCRTPDAFYRLLCREGVTVLNQTPSAFSQLVALLARPDQRPVHALRYVIFGGEALDLATLRPWLERYGDQSPRLVNMYGITETTVHVSYRPVRLSDLDSAGTSPIGKVIPDLSWYLLDDSLNPVAGAVQGELYIGRDGLSRGYLRRPGLTAERFIPDPFGAVGGRLYRSGDLACQAMSGEMHYRARADHQVKIRGFRIELGEVRAHLLALPGVGEGTVMAREGSAGTVLVGYVVPASGRGSVERQREFMHALKHQLSQRLPDYMVPAQIVLLDHMPLTHNGKLDSTALPGLDAALMHETYVAPHTDTQKRIAAIWAAALGVDQVGLADNFFERGGHSLLVAVVQGQLQSELHINTPIALLFQFPRLSDFVEQAEQCATRVDGDALDRLEMMFEEVESN